jgi:hypothetical protein
MVVETDRKNKFSYGLSGRPSEVSMRRGYIGRLLKFFVTVNFSLQNLSIG